jgi:hypothetical protein
MYINSVERLPHFGKTAFRMADPSRVSFQDFLSIVLEYRNCHLEQLSRYIPPDVSYVIRFESFDDGLNAVRRKIGLKKRNTIWTNKCDHKDFHHYYTSSKMVDAVALMYKDDIERFGYQYE